MADLEVDGEILAAHRGGRIHRRLRRVRLADVGPQGAARFDAVARWLQDVATDDVRDAGVEEAVAWVVRRTTITAGRRPRYNEMIEVSTWCSATGASLAERRTSITGEDGASVEAVALWVSLDRESLRPAPLPDAPFEPYRKSAADRRVRSKLLLAGPTGAEDRPGFGARPWPLRASDIDLYIHVNNAVAWIPAEEEADRLLGTGRARWGRVEYRRAVEPWEVPVVWGCVSAGPGGAVDVWLLGADGAASVAARMGA